MFLLKFFIQPCKAYKNRLPNIPQISQISNLNKAFYDSLRLRVASAITRLFFVSQQPEKNQNVLFEGVYSTM